MAEFPLSLLFTLIALVFVLVLAWFALRMLSRLGNGKFSSQRIRVTHTVPVGAREKLLLVECDDREYLLGVTSNGIAVIRDQEKPAATVQPTV